MATMRAGSYQSLSWGAASIGGITSAYFSGSLIEQYGVSFVFGLTAFFPLLTLGSALLISEKRVPRLEGPTGSGSSFDVQLQQVRAAAPEQASLPMYFLMYRVPLIRSVAGPIRWRPCLICCAVVRSETPRHRLGGCEPTLHADLWELLHRQ